jgi:hypothetical protein
MQRSSHRYNARAPARAVFLFVLCVTSNQDRRSLYSSPRDILRLLQVCLLWLVYVVSVAICVPQMHANSVQGSKWHFPCSSLSELLEARPKQRAPSALCAGVARRLGAITQRDIKLWKVMKVLEPPVWTGNGGVSRGGAIIGCILA